MNSYELTPIECFDFGLNEDWNTDREKAIKKTICELYLKKIEYWCSFKFNKEVKRKSGQRYFSLEFSKLSLNENNLRTQVYYSLQHPIRDEIENHLKMLHDKFPDLDSKITITTDATIYQNCRSFCYLILEPEINDFILSHINDISHFAVVKKNSLEEIIENISVHISEKIQDEIDVEISNLKIDYPDEQKRKKEIFKIKNSKKYKLLGSNNDKLLWEYYLIKPNRRINYSKLAKCIVEIKDNNIENVFPIKQNLIEEITGEINNSELLSPEVDHKKLFKASPDYKSHKKDKVKVKN